MVGLRGRASRARRTVASRPARVRAAAFGLAPPRCGVARHGDMPVDGRAKHVDARAAGAKPAAGYSPEEGRAF